MVRLPYFADPANLTVEEDQPKPKKVEEGPEGETSLQLLQTVYRDRKQPLNVRVRCAVEALAHEYPRVSAVAVTSMSGQSFAKLSTGRLNAVKRRCLYQRQGRRLNTIQKR